MNLTVLQGCLSRAPERRVLPSGDVLVVYEVTVAAGGGRRAESVPVVWPDPPNGADDMEVETDVVVVGRVRRRFFRSGGSTQSRTEVVADKVVPVRQTRRAARAVRDAVGALERRTVA